MARTTKADLEQQLAELKARNERLLWHILTLQRALGVESDLRASYGGGLGPLRLVFTLTISDQAWLLLLKKEPATREAVIAAAGSHFEEQLDLWVQNLQKQMETE